MKVNIINGNLTLIWHKVKAREGNMMYSQTG